MTHEPIKVNSQWATIKLLLMSMASQPKALKDLGTPSKPSSKILEEDVFLGASFKPCQNPNDP